MEKFKAVILAAGKGTRMNKGQPAPKPKVLYEISGKPMILYLVESLEKAGLSRPFMVIGHRGKMIEDVLKNRCQYINQQETQGTGGSVMVCKDRLKNRYDNVVVCYGDTALTQPETFKKLTNLHLKNKATATFLTAIFPDPNSFGYGRVRRDQKGKVLAIVEQKLATPEELKIKECNCGAYVFDASWLWQNIGKIKKRPKGEYYLTDLVEMAINQGKKVLAIPTPYFLEGLGVNSLENLQEAEKLLTNYVLPKKRVSAIYNYGRQQTNKGKITVKDLNKVIGSYRQDK